MGSLRKHDVKARLVADICQVCIDFSGNVNIDYVTNLKTFTCPKIVSLCMDGWRGESKIFLSGARWPSMQGMFGLWLMGYAPKMFESENRNLINFKTVTSQILAMSQSRNTIEVPVQSDSFHFRRSIHNSFRLFKFFPPSKRDSKPPRPSPLHLKSFPGMTVQYVNYRTVNDIYKSVEGSRWSSSSARFTSSISVKKKKESKPIGQCQQLKKICWPVSTLSPCLVTKQCLMEFSRQTCHAWIGLSRDFAVHFLQTSISMTVSRCFFRLDIWCKGSRWST